MKPCTSDTGRYRWGHVKNFTDKRVHVGPHGTAITFKQAGLYRCTICGAKKAGAPRTETQGAAA